MQLDTIAPSMGLQTHSAPSFSSPNPIGYPAISPMVGCKHLSLYLSGSGRASQEAARLGFFQQALLGIHNSVWVWFMRWISRCGGLWMVMPSVSAPNFVSVTPSMGVLFPILRRGKVATLWSLFFLSFMRLANCILYLGYSKFLG